MSVRNKETFLLQRGGAGRTGQEAHCTQRDNAQGQTDGTTFLKGQRTTILEPGCRVYCGRKESVACARSTLQWVLRPALILLTHPTHHLDRCKPALQALTQAYYHGQPCNPQQASTELTSGAWVGPKTQQKHRGQTLADTAPGHSTH